MKANEIKVGGRYTMKVAGNVVVVRVDAIREQFDYRDRSRTVYNCTNLKTGRKVTARSPQRFRSNWDERRTAAGGCMQATFDAEKERRKNEQLSATRIDS